MAPHLEAFKASCLPVNLTVSNANASQISWFSIFHSNVPLYWSALKKQGWTSGSPSLSILKKMGYKIRVYTAANLAYYGLDELIFGKDLHLADSFQPFLHTTAKEAWKSDAETLEAFAQDLSMDRDLVEGQCCIFFWDSTHFDYSWPRDEPPLFAPVASEINYFRAIQSKENIELIKNRIAMRFITSMDCLDSFCHSCRRKANRSSPLRAITEKNSSSMDISFTTRNSPMCRHKCRSTSARRAALQCLSPVQPSSPTWISSRLFSTPLNQTSSPPRF